MKSKFRIVGVATTMAVIATNVIGIAATAENHEDPEKGWIQLFDGSSLEGWEAVENPETFSLKDGVITAHGPRAHLYYTGSVQNADFKNFELKVDVMTRKGSNGGIFVQTKFQKEGWPAKGFEVQVNNTFTRDPRKTGSLYNIDDVFDQHVQDDEWFTEHIIVNGDRIIIKVNDKTLVDWTQPKKHELADAQRVSSGTIALQGHDPGSTVHYKNIRIKPLPDK